MMRKKIYEFSRKDYQQVFWKRVRTVVFCLLMIGVIPYVFGESIKAKTHITGKIISKEISTGKKWDYNFSVLLGPKGYSIQLFENQINLITEVYHDSVDTIVFNPKPVGFPVDEEGSFAYDALICSTPFPFHAPEEVQLIWTGLCANKTILENTLTNYPPGIIYSNVFLFSALNWYEFSLDEIEYRESVDERISHFVQNAPGALLYRESDLIKQGTSEKTLEKYKRSPYTGEVLLPLLNFEKGYVAYGFKSFGKFQDTEFPETSVLSRYEFPLARMGVNAELTLSVEKVEEVNMQIPLPVVPLSRTLKLQLKHPELVEFKDYRFNGILTYPVYYVLPFQDVWPLTGSKVYYRERENATGLKPPIHKPNSILISILTICILFSPIIVFGIKQIKNKKKHA